jgi:hypothetical protein
MAEQQRIRDQVNAIVTAGNGINSSLSGFSWAQNHEHINRFAGQIDALQRAVAPLAEVRRGSLIEIGSVRRRPLPSSGERRFESTRTSSVWRAPISG